MHARVAAYTLDGLLPAGAARVTQTELLTFNAQQRHVQSDLELGIHGFGVRPFSNHTLVLRLIGAKKFSVRSVASC